MMKLPAQPTPLPKYQVVIQGRGRGAEFRVAVYRLVEYKDGLSYRRAQNEGRAIVKSEERCEHGSCSVPSF
jgi:hypothetical protein